MYAGPYGVAIAGPRYDSLTEEQGPELSLVTGLPLVTEVTDGCDPEQGTRSSGNPGGSITGFGFKNLLDDPGTIQIPGTSGITRVDRMVWLANYKIANLAIILAQTKIPSEPNTLPVGANGNLLKACVNKIAPLLNKGNFQCAAEQVYRCENIVDAQAAYNGGTGFTAFGPSKLSVAPAGSVR